MLWYRSIYCYGTHETGNKKSFFYAGHSYSYSLIVIKVARIGTVFMQVIHVFSNNIMHRYIESTVEYETRGTVQSNVAFVSIVRNLRGVSWPENSLHYKL